MREFTDPGNWESINLLALCWDFRRVKTGKCYCECFTGNVKSLCFRVFVLVRKVYTACGELFCWKINFCSFSTFSTLANSSAFPPCSQLTAFPSPKLLCCWWEFRKMTVTKYSVMSSLENMHWNQRAWTQFCFALNTCCTGKWGEIHHYFWLQVPYPCLV